MRNTERMNVLSNASFLSDAQDRLVGTAKAADLLGVDKATVTRWVSSGKLRAAKIDGNAYIFDRTEIEQLAKETAK